MAENAALTMRFLSPPLFEYIDAAITAAVSTDEVRLRERAWLSHMPLPLSTYRSHRDLRRLTDASRH